MDCNLRFLMVDINFPILCLWQSFTEESFLILVKSNQIWIIITLFRLIWHQIYFRLGQNQSKNCNYNPNALDLTEFRTDKSVCVDGKQAGDIDQGVMPNKLSHRAKSLCSKTENAQTMVIAILVGWHLYIQYFGNNFCRYHASMCLLTMFAKSNLNMVLWNGFFFNSKQRTLQRNVVIIPVIAAATVLAEAPTVIWEPQKKEKKKSQTNQSLFENLRLKSTKRCFLNLDHKLTLNKLSGYPPKEGLVKRILLIKEYF